MDAPFTHVDLGKLHHTQIGSSLLKIGSSASNELGADAAHGYECGDDALHQEVAKRIMSKVDKRGKPCGCY